MLHELAQIATPGGVEREPVVGQQPLRHTVRGDGLVEDHDRGVSGLAFRDVRGDRVAGVVIDELEDHTLAAAREDVPISARWRRAASRRSGRDRRTAAILWRAERGFFLGSRRATPASRKILDSDAVDGTASNPIAFILSCTLIGPQSRPEDSSAARTCRAEALASSLNRDGLDRGRLERGSSTAAGPSTWARLRSS